MISFDYVRSARPAWVRRLGEVRVPVPVQIAVACLCAAVLTIASAAALERARLHAAIATETRYAAEYRRSAIGLHETRAYLERVRALVQLSDRVARIRASGVADALRFSDIAARLPQHAWLESIQRDSATLSIAGRAKDLAVLARLLQRLNGSRYVRNPSLQSATIASEGPSRGSVSYQIGLEAAP